MKPLNAVILALGTLLSSPLPLRAQVPEEPTYTLSLHEWTHGEVMRLLERILVRPIEGGDIDTGSVTLFAGAEVGQSEVVAVISFVLSLDGLRIAESQTGALKIERIPDFRAACDRPRADVAELLSTLTRERATAPASVQLAAVPGYDAIRGLSEGLSAVVAISQTDPPVGEITLSSGARTLPDTYAMLFDALERAGNRVVAGPSGSLAIVGCSREPARKVRLDAERPRLQGTFLSEHSALALISGGEPAWSRTYEVGDSFFHGKLLEIRSDGVLFKQGRACADLALGEAGAGRSVACPTNTSHGRSAPEASPVILTPVAEP